MNWREQLQRTGWVEGADGSWSKPSGQSRVVVGGLVPAKPQQDPGRSAAVADRGKALRKAGMVERRRQPPVGPAFVVSIVAHVRRRRDEGDNLEAGMKWLRDAIAVTLGVDDGDTDRVMWQYGQVVTRGRTGAVVTIEER